MWWSVKVLTDMDLLCLGIWVCCDSLPQLWVGALGAVDAACASSCLHFSHTWVQCLYKGKREQTYCKKLMTWPIFIILLTYVQVYSHQVQIQEDQKTLWQTLVPVYCWASLCRCRYRKLCLLHNPKYPPLQRKGEWWVCIPTGYRQVQWCTVKTCMIIWGGELLFKRDLQISLGKYPNRLDFFQTPVKKCKLVYTIQYSQSKKETFHTERIFAFRFTAFPLFFYETCAKQTLPYHVFWIVWLKQKQIGPYSWSTSRTNFCLNRS